jgi:hypothetical protein
MGFLGCSGGKLDFFCSMKFYFCGALIGSLISTPDWRKTF